MSKINPEKIKKTQTVLKKKKVFVFPLLISLLSCSIRTGRLKLKQWGAYSSYNQNGKYYTLPGVPDFDDNGLWWYKDIYFSKHGTLKNTVVHLINKSISGLSGDQIDKIIALSPRSFLHHFRDTPGIRRQKHAGLYVYFSDDADRYNQQVQSRLKALGEHISDADAVMILVALIKHHNISIDDFAMLPEAKARKLSAQAIREFLERHGLGKKTPSTKP